MSSAHAIQELEAFLQQPPPNWNSTSAGANNPMAVAHAALEYLRESGDEQFLFLRTILELTARQQHHHEKLNPHEEELFFHCVTGCRQVAIWQYKSKYCSHLLSTLRNFLMVLGFEPAFQGKTVTSRTIQMACFTSSVALWKRGWNELLDQSEANEGSNHAKQPTPEEESLIHGMMQLSQSVLAAASEMAPILLVQFQTPQDVFHAMEQLIKTKNFLLVEGASLYLQSFVTEFVGRSAISYRLPLEYHKKAHRSFEREGSLTKALNCALIALGQVLTELAESPVNQQPSPVTMSAASATVQFTLDCLGWEFGMGAWEVGKLGEIGALSASTRTCRAPVQWKNVLHPIPIVKALVHVILKLEDMSSDRLNSLAQSLRQLLLTMASLTGPIFLNSQERQEFASILLTGTLDLLQKVKTHDENSYLIDVLQILGRLVANFRLSVLADLAQLLNPVLQGMAAVGQKLLHDQIQDCQRAMGNIDDMDLREWREEALSILLMDCAVLLASDPWLMYSGTETSRRQAQKHLAALILGPIYQGMVECRTRMAALEEHYLVSHETHLDEAEEEIIENDMNEEMDGIAQVGRLDLGTALGCLAERHSQTMPQLQSLWGDANVQVVTAETAALLEEARLLTMYVSHLLTDNNKGESPAIPMAVLQACQEEYDLRKDNHANADSGSITSSISSAVHAMIQFAEAQMKMIAANPNNMRLSPILAKTFLQFLQRWAPAYIYPSGYEASQSENPIVHEWSSEQKALEAINFCISLCLCYQCYWPQEKLLQEEAALLLKSLVKRGGKVRQALIHSPAFVETVKFHCVTCGMRHGAPEHELQVEVRNRVGDGATEATWNMIKGYQRLPYDDRAQIFSIILLACSDPSHPASAALFNDALKAVHDAFVSLIQALGQSAVTHDDINAKEMTCLCLSMIYGITNASEMNGSERIPLFLTPFLPQLAGLMVHYATDLTVCEKLLQIFQNYASQFVVLLNREQSLALFQASADLLKGYSKHHCSNRAIHKSSSEAEAQEEQAYSDILCVIQLLTNLGAKDFIDACNTSGENGVDSAQVTDMIFFGLQQILPLMTQGLLQFPTLCNQFFELVSFMMETYPDKVCRLPFDLFNPLLQSLLFGMSHHDVNVAKAALYGLASISREHLKSQALQPILTQQAPDLLDHCLNRLFTEVIFRSAVMDRQEACGMALLPLAAANLPRLSNIMTQICDSTYQKDDRLKQALGELLTHEKLSNAGLAGYEGRRQRVLFKDAFADFVTKVQLFLVLR